MESSSKNIIIISNRFKKTCINLCDLAGSEKLQDPYEF